MTRQWQPGDVALVRVSSGDEVVRMLTKAPKDKFGKWWGLASSEEEGFTRFYRQDSQFIESIRPLVVIDPEHREQAERLMGLLVAETPKVVVGFDPNNQPALDRLYANAMQAALRAYANPTPPIEEPTGLGAVVEDNHGDPWTRVHHPSSADDWFCDGQTSAWSDLNVARVLSEGVTE